MLNEYIIANLFSHFCFESISFLREGQIQKLQIYISYKQDARALYVNNFYKIRPVLAKEGILYKVLLLLLNKSTGVFALPKKIVNKKPCK